MNGAEGLVRAHQLIVASLLACPYVLRPIVRLVRWFYPRKETRR